VLIGAVISNAAGALPPEQKKHHQNKKIKPQPWIDITNGHKKDLLQTKVFIDTIQTVVRPRCGNE